MNPKGISALIAIILLLLITITIAGFIYTFFISLQERSGDIVSEQSKQELQRTGTEFKIDNVYLNQVYIRNTGRSSIDASKIAFYVNDEFVQAVADQATIEPGKIVNFTIAVTPVENDIVEATLSQTSASYFIRPDTRPPSIAFAEPPTPPNGGSTTSPFTIQVRVGDPSGVDVCILEWNGITNITMTKSGSGASFTCSTSVSAAVGTYNYKVYANDTKGFMAVSDIRSVTIVVTDTGLPEIMFVPPTPANATTIFSSSVTINASVTDALSSITQCTLEWNNINETMTIVGSGSAVSCNVTKTGLTDGTYSYKVYASDSQNNLNVSETRTVSIVIIPAQLSVRLDKPDEDSVNNTIQNRTITVKANVTCMNNDCGNVQGTLRRNSTSGGQPDTDVPSGSGTPLFTVESNPQSCGVMNANDFCQITWTMNVSGAIGTNWLVGANFTSDSGLSNKTGNATINITGLPPPPPPSVIAFSYVIETNDQTTTSTSWQSRATIQAGNFTAGGKYLILATAQVGGSSTSSSVGFRLARSSGTGFTGSEFNIEPSSTTVSTRYQYGYMTVWTVSSPEDVVFQIRSLSGATARADTIVIFAMRLDQNLVENQDWYFSENTALTQHTTAFQNFASTTVNAGIGEDWLVIANPSYIIDSNTVNAEYRIDRDSGATLAPMFTQEGRETTQDERLTWLLFRVYNLAVGSHTFTVQGRDDATGVNDHNSSRIFALNLTKFKDYGSFWNEAETSITTSFSTVGSVAFTPQVQSDFLIMGFVASDVGSAGVNTNLRIQANGATTPTGADAQTTSRSYDSTDESPGGQIAITNLGTISQTINMDAQGSTTFPVEDRSLFALSMTLAQP